MSEDASQMGYTSVQMREEVWEAFKQFSWAQGMYAKDLLDQVIREFLAGHRIEVAVKAESREVVSRIVRA